MATYVDERSEAGAADRSNRKDVWSGIFPTVLTPFTPEGALDVAALEGQLRYVIRGGVHGLVLLGTVGEGQYVTDEERDTIVATAVRVSRKALPVVVGIHTGDADVAQRQMRRAGELGATAVLIKYCGRPGTTAAEVLQFFTSLSALDILPMFYYNFPRRTGLHFTPAEIAAILRLPGVIGVKQSTTKLRQIEKQMELTRGLGKKFFTGGAVTLTQFLNSGGQGAMCPEAVLLPDAVVRAYTDHVQGRRSEARSLQKKFFEMMPILRLRAPSPAISRFFIMLSQDYKLLVPYPDDIPDARLKAALNLLGVPMSTVVRVPLPPMTADEMRRVQAALSRLIRMGLTRAAGENADRVEKPAPERPHHEAASS